ncbi:MAG: hypothetical protein AAF297_03225 [Planctomycetota bacterium]
MTTNGSPNPTHGNGQSGHGRRAVRPAANEADAVLAAADAAGFTMDEALDAVELGPTDPRLSPLLARLGEHPALVARLSALRADRGLLESAARVRPVSVRDGTMIDAAIDQARAEAEREALLSLERGSEFDTPPVSRIIPIRRRWYDRLRYQVTTSPTTMWFAAAAALLLLVSGTAAVLADRLGLLIHAPQRMADTTPPSPRTVEPEPTRAFAEAPPITPDPDLPRATPNDVAIITLADLEEATTALAAGRLAIVARGRVAALSEIDRPDGLWRIESAATRATVASLPMTELSSMMFPSERGGTGTGAAGLVAGNAGRITDPQSRGLPGRSSPIASEVALARVGLGRAALASMVVRLERVGFEVSFIELADAVEAPADLSPEALGWWGKPPTAWPERAVVPIIVAPVD